MLAVGVLLPATLAAEELPLIQNVDAYECLSLNGEWNYIVDVQEEGYYDYRMNPMRGGFFANAKPEAGPSTATTGQRTSDGRRSSRRTSTSRTSLCSTRLRG